jgi:lantibiotic modifying enzyme
MEHIRTKVEEALNKIFEEIEKNPDFEDKHSLLVGTPGIIVFLIHYYTHFPEERVSEKAEKLIQELLREITEYPSWSHTFSDGLVGIKWLLEYLCRKEILDADSLDLSDDLNKLTFSICKTLIEHNNIDFLHGAVGVLGQLSNEDEIREAIILLMDRAKTEEDILYWPDTYLDETELGKKVVNIGLSHGISSQLCILSKANPGLFPEPGKEAILSSIIATILKAENKPGSHSLFPDKYYFTDENGFSGLSWCYGDMGIAFALWRSGQAMQRTDWQEEAIRIMKHAATRFETDKDFIKDACLCHGTAGIAHMFNRFYKETNLPEFRKASLQWIEATLEMSKHSDGLAGYKMWQGKDKAWGVDYGLLEGIAGVGLALLGFLAEDTEELAWDSCLLLS